MSTPDENEIERLRKLAHDAPLNKVFQDHTGHKFLGSHSMAWADASRAYAEAISCLPKPPVSAS